MEANEAIRSSFPSSPGALRPHLPIGEPNDPIILYTGRIDLFQEGKTFQAEGRVYLDWLPSPVIRFEMPKLLGDEQFSLEDQLCRIGEASFRLDDGTEGNRCLVTGAPLRFGADGHSCGLSGITNERVIRPADGPVQHVQFFLPNFHCLRGQVVRDPGGGGFRSRHTLRGCGWVITLDAVDNQFAVSRFLKSNSGFGITHVGRLEREDAKLFTAQEAFTILDALIFYASFAAGHWTCPCLPTGFDTTGKQIWQAWDNSRNVPFLRRDSWLDVSHSEQFEAPFPGFLKLWIDEDWREVVHSAIHWYMEANALAGSIEGSIVLTQTAFELLASAVFVERLRQFTPENFDKLKAADRIGRLFLWAGIPTAIPAELGDLTRLARTENCQDSATAMTMIRNTIMHPTKKNREKFDKDSANARRDAWILGLWNLELCLLRLFEYRGRYGNRIRRRWVGEVESVPWAQCATRADSTPGLET